MIKLTTTLNNSYDSYIVLDGGEVTIKGKMKKVLEALYKLAKVKPILPQHGNPEFVIAQRMTDEFEILKIVEYEAGKYPEDEWLIVF